MSTSPQELDKTTSSGLLALAFAQAMALYLLHLSFDHETWPSTESTWLTACYTLAIALPGFFYLSITRLKDHRNLLAAVVLGPLLFWLGWHLGWARGEKSDTFEFVFPFTLSVGVALFILAFFFRAWTMDGRPRFTYARLLSLSWQNALTLAQLGIFIGAFWLLLALWAALFAAIGIDVFAEAAFIYPVTGLIGGLGLLLIRNRIGLIATVQFMCEALIKALLPLAAFIGMIFLAALPFTGLQVVWDTGHAAVLMMLLVAVLLFFFNAVLSNRAEAPPYPMLLWCFVLAAVALLPINAALAAWALSLRIDQYGLSVERLWAAIILALLAVYAMSYAVLVVWRRRSAMPSIQLANKVLALVVTGVLLLVNTPLADPRGIAANNQVARLTAGRIEPAAFDYAYLRFALGAYGEQALRDLRKSEYADRHPEIGKRIATVFKQEHRWSIAPPVINRNPAALREMLVLRPANAWPADELLLTMASDPATQGLRCFDSASRCLLAHLHGSGVRDMWAVLVTANRNFGLVFAKLADAWQQIGQLNLIHCAATGGESRGETRLEEHQRLTRVPGPFFVLNDGECHYHLTANEGYLLRALNLD